MRQITTTSKILDEQKQELRKDRHEDKGRVLAISRRVYRIQNTDIFYYVESETSDDHYYFVKFKPDVFGTVVVMFLQRQFYKTYQV